MLSILCLLLLWIATMTTTTARATVTTTTTQFLWMPAHNNHQHNTHSMSPIFASVADVVHLNSTVPVIRYHEHWRIPPSLAHGIQQQQQQQRHTQPLCFEVHVVYQAKDVVFRLQNRMKCLESSVESDVLIDICLLPSSPSSSGSSGVDCDMHQLLGLLSAEQRVIYVELQPLEIQEQLKFARNVVMFGRPTTTTTEEAEETSINISPAQEEEEEEILSGQNEIVSIADTGIDVSHCFFQTNNNNDKKILLYRRVITERERQTPELYYNTDVSHGTHIASIAVGHDTNNNNNNNEPNFSSLAFQAQVVMHQLSKHRVRGLAVPLDLLNQILRPARTVDAYVFSHSWGSRLPQIEIYGSKPVQIDTFMHHECPRCLVVQSAGNKGSSQHALVSPGISKNCLTVGSMKNGRVPLAANADYEDVLSVFSSRGPTTDNRFKPDIVTIGEWVVAAKARPLYTLFEDPFLDLYRHTNPSSSSSWDGNGQCNAMLISYAGSSQAVAMAAGSVALLRSFYRQRYAGINAAILHNINNFPSGALLKASMIHCARPLLPSSSSSSSSSSSFHPHSDYGFGTPVLHEILKYQTKQHAQHLFASDAGYFLNTHTNNNNHTRRLSNHSTKHCVCMRPSSSSPPCASSSSSDAQLVATLVWTDAPVSMHTEGSVLMNDLDLKIVEWQQQQPPPSSPSSSCSSAETAGTNHTRLPDSNADADHEEEDKKHKRIWHFSNGFVKVPDRTNNVERVMIVDVHPKSEFCVFVKAHRVLQAPQAYALLITIPSSHQFVTTSHDGLPRLSNVKRTRENIVLELKE